MATWSDSLRSRRVRHALAATSAAAVIALSGCSSTFTAQPYTPGVGTNVDQGSMLVRSLVLVVDGERAWLTGAVVSEDGADTLTRITGTAQNSQGEDQDGGALTFPDGQIAVPSGGMVNLTGKNLSTPAGELTPGLTAKLTLHFQQAGDATLVVPVVDKSHPDYATFTPTAQP